MSGIVNSTGAKSGIIGTTVGTPAGATGVFAGTGTQGSAVSDVPTRNDPGYNTIGGLTSSGTYTQGEFNALRDKCENVRDFVSQTRDTVNTIISRMEALGLIAS